MSEQPESRPAAQILGACTQGILLGVPLFFALVKLITLAEGAAIFRYQAF